VSRIVLDAGALIALESNDRSLWADLKLWSRVRDDVLVPSTVLAQVWRGSPSQVHLSRALRHVVIAPFDPVARRVGELCARARSADICDAHVALIASSCDALYTSDPGDMRRLLGHLDGDGPAIIRC
jgi:hypothetical protein